MENFKTRQEPDGSSRVEHPEHRHLLRDSRDVRSQNPSSTWRRYTASSTFTNVSDMSEHTQIFDSMTSYSMTSIFEDSSFLVDRTCDQVSSSSSSFESMADDTHCVPEGLTREIEGCEDPDLTTLFPENEPDHSMPSFSTQTVTSQQLKARPFSEPLASSTMIEENNIIEDCEDLVPCASSTMTTEKITQTHYPPTKVYPCPQECPSIVTWSIHDNSEETVFDESYVKGHYVSSNKKDSTSNHVNLQASGISHPSSGSHKEIDIFTNDTCVTDALSMIDHFGVFRDQRVLNESDSNRLPRTSTKVNLSDVEDLQIVPSLSEKSHETMGPEAPKSSGFKITSKQLKKLFSLKRFKGKMANETYVKEPKNAKDIIERRDAVYTESLDDIQNRDKKAIARKMKKFTANFHRADRTGLQRMTTLANL